MLKCKDVGMDFKHAEMPYMNNGKKDVGVYITGGLPDTSVLIIIAL